jgi:deazaflavin-dependent oxidoreductase (nitroreductase family)
VSASPTDFNQQIIDEFRANGGEVGGPFESAPMLLLHHAGARSGQERVSPLVYLADDGRYAIFATKGGAPTNPAWYHNLKAHPDVTIEVGSETIRARAEEVTGPERDRIYGLQAAGRPTFAEYERKTDRVIPVILLTPVEWGRAAG